MLTKQQDNFAFIRRDFDGKYLYRGRISHVNCVLGLGNK